MSEEMMNTKEVARYLDIHEKQVYALIKTGRMPATRVTGKWIFPKKVIDDWIETNAKSGLERRGRRAAGLPGRCWPREATTRFSTFSIPACGRPIPNFSSSRRIRAARRG